MALKFTLRYKGINIPGVYAKVTSFTGDKSKCSFNLGFFGAEDDAGIREEIVSSHYSNTSFDLGGENPIKQAYIYLKTLPEFEGAADC